MKFAWFRLAALVILGHALAWAQQPSDNSSNTLAYENGSITNNVYTNDCFGFSFVIPDGWQLKVMGTEGKARHFSKGDLVLLIIDKPKEGTPEGEIVLIARDASGPIFAALNAQEFVSNVVHARVNDDRQHSVLVRNTYGVDYAGRHFFRADYKQTIDGRALYRAVVYTKFRGFYVGEMLGAGSPEELELAASSLKGTSFREDKLDSRCVMSGDATANSLGIIWGVLSSKPGMSESISGLPMRVRVSQGVAAGLLVFKVEPKYPDDARLGRIQGQVVLRVLVDKNGNVDGLTLVSGHPLLAPAALEAVKQWKYKPYLVNGQPLGAETQVVVSFSLSGGF
jgi:TonB family protein